MLFKICSLALLLLIESHFTALAAQRGEIVISRTVPVINNELTLRLQLPKNVQLQDTATLNISLAGQSILQRTLTLANADGRSASFTPRETGFYKAVIDFGAGSNAERIVQEFPVVWRDMYFLVWGPPTPDERLAYGPLTAQVIAPNRKPETIKYWLDHGSDVVAWIGAPKSQPSGVISDEQMADWIKEISEQVDRGCNGIFIDEFGGYPTEYGINRMRSIGVMLQQARERFPDLLIMPATAGAIQRELSIAYQEVGAVALLESYPTCFTRFFASHNFKKHLDWRIETARNTDLIHRVGKGQAAIVLLGTRVCGAHEEPVAAEVEHHVRYIKKTAPEMPGIGFYGDRYDGMTRQLVRMVNDYYIKPVVDLRAIRFAPYTAAAGKSVDVLVGIHNLGGMTARDIKVHVYAGEHGTAKKERIGTLSINAIGYGHRDLEPKQQGQLVEYQQVNGSRYAVIPNEQNRVFLARTTGKVTWTPERSGYYTITAEVQPSAQDQFTILDGALQETLLVK
jgi:hypothetical protein